MTELSITSRNITIRPIQERDVSAIHGLIPSLDPLTQHTWYAYWNLFKNFGDSCFVAEDGCNQVGFITSHPTTTPPLEWFVWQVGLLEQYRGHGIVDRLQDEVIDIARRAGAVAIRTTIEVNNSRSFGVFARMAERLESKMEELESFSVPESETPEVLYRIQMN